MLHATERLTGPRYLDADIANRVKDATIKRYRLALQRFLAFLLRNKYFPSVSAHPTNIYSSNGNIRMW